jgi:hypothetical protein
MPFSENSWSQFTAADYSLAQWHKACLIHLHDGAPTSKDACKLPVMEPDGTYNRNAIHAAAGALAGARGGVQAAAAKKRASARKLVRLYREMGDEPPENLVRLAG